MNNLYAKTVFFVEDAERSSRFYVEQLGFSEDWAHNEGGHVYVCQVSLLGFEVILNEINDETQLDSNTATAPA
jgi:catechol 2,3-dioxygenase-like lactoylglutathione lyase family enzyme